MCLFDVQRSRIPYAKIINAYMKEKRQDKKDEKVELKWNHTPLINRSDALKLPVSDGCVSIKFNHFLPCNSYPLDKKSQGQ